MYIRTQCILNRPITVGHKSQTRSLRWTNFQSSEIGDLRLPVGSAVSEAAEPNDTRFDRSLSKRRSRYKMRFGRFSSKSTIFSSLFRVIFQFILQQFRRSARRWQSGKSVANKFWVELRTEMSNGFDTKFGRKSKEIDWSCIRERCTAIFVFSTDNRNTVHDIPNLTYPSEKCRRIQKRYRLAWHRSPNNEWFHRSNSVRATGLFSCIEHCNGNKRTRDFYQIRLEATSGLGRINMTFSKANASRFDVLSMYAYRVYSCNVSVSLREEGRSRSFYEI